VRSVRMSPRAMGVLRGLVVVMRSLLLLVISA
jgi:hypothetical protein